METNLQKLLDFFKSYEQSLNYDDFYVISFRQSSIELQGQFSTELARKLTEIGFVFEFNQHLIGKCISVEELSLIRVVLT